MSRLQDQALSLSTRFITERRSEEVKEALRVFGRERVTLLEEHELAPFIRLLGGTPYSTEKHFRIEEDLYKIEPTSCRCGGSWAWLKQRPSGAWDMVGCVCHTLPTGQKIVNEIMPPAGDVVLVDKATMQAVVDASLSVIKPVAAQLRKMGLVR